MLLTILAEQPVREAELAVVLLVAAAVRGKELVAPRGLLHVFSQKKVLCPNKYLLSNLVCLYLRCFCALLAVVAVVVHVQHVHHSLDHGLQHIRVEPGEAGLDRLEEVLKSTAEPTWPSVERIRTTRTQTISK